jgi:arylsulfatase A-like enzyme
MRIGGRLVALFRAVAAAFLIGTALYGVIAFSPFGYDQFVKPHAIRWMVWCVTYLDALALAVLSLTVISLTSDLDRRSTRIAALAFMALGALVVASLFVHNTVDGLVSDRWSLVVTAIAIAAAVWLAAIDHAACWRSVFDRSEDESTADSGLFSAAAVSTVYVAAVYAAIASFRPTGRADLSVSAAAVARSLLLHAMIFGAVAWTLAGAVRFARFAPRKRLAEYVVGLVILTVAGVAAMRLLIVPALELSGVTAFAVSIIFAATFAASWSGIAVRVAASDPIQRSGFEMLAGPIAPWRSSRAAIAVLAILPCAIYLQMWTADRVDAPRFLYIVCVLAVWVIVGSTMVRAARRLWQPTQSVAVGASVALLAIYPIVVSAERGSSDRGLLLQAFDRQAALDPSFDLVDLIASGRPLVTTSLQRFELANSNVADTIAFEPTDVDVAAHMRPSTEPPNIYVFVIDSLRPDYLSPYNPAVTFTTAIDALARDSLVFHNAFSRYGGTGLAIPAIWAGGMVPHRSYVTPFAPMNALKKLLDANGYRLMTSYDSIMVRLLPRTPEIVELGGESWTARDDVCRVLSDLHEARAAAGTDPVFAYSLPQNVHLTYVQGHPILNEEYPGFYSLLAARVHEVDRCLGRFVAELKADGTYDNSVIVITSDHGDAIGEEGRWGHGLAVFPEVLRIPLILHLPSRMRNAWSADMDAVSFSTDIVPTLYRLLGYDVSPLGPTFGTPLVDPLGTKVAEERRRGAFLVGASYGAVYGLLQRNGTSLYVSDAINSRDYAYDLPPGTAPVRVRVTPAERLANQRLIREQIDRIAAFYRFDAEPRP